jgi:hypothetical protein
MKLGEIARVARGVVTGNRSLFILSRADARTLGLESFAKPVLASTRDFPKDGQAVVRDNPEREVVIIATRRDVEEHAALRAYLGQTAPKIGTFRPAPIAATYVGVPRFVANPDGLVITNALYTVTPRQSMTAEEILALVDQLNAAMSKRAKPRLAERFTPRELEGVGIG